MRGVARPFSAHARGASAVEFAIVAPMFLLLMLGIVCFGTIFGIYNGVEQLAAESARASVGGLSAAERDQLARTYIAGNVGAYPFLDSSKLTVTTGTSATSPTTYQVSVTYDMSGSFIYAFGNLIGLPPPNVVRTAAVQFGGY